MSKFSYQRRDPSTMRKRSEQWGNERDSFLKDHVPVWKPNDGENVIRILPPSWDGADHYGLDVYVHYSVGPDNSAYLDLFKMKKIPDPITEESQQARQDGDEEYAKQLDSKKRVLVYLIDRDKPKEGPMLWAMPWTVDKEIAIHSWDNRTQEALPIDSPEEGFDVIINRQGKGARTEYTVKIARNPSPLNMTPEIIALLDEHPLPECLNFYPYEHIQKAFLGGGKKPMTTKESHTEEPTKRGETARPAAKRSKVAVDLSGLTWKSVHRMAGPELDELVQQLDDEAGIDLSHKFFETDSQLADAICEALNLEDSSVARTPARRSSREEPAQEEAPHTARRAKVEEPEDEPEEEAEPEPPKPAKTGSYRDRLAGINKARS